MLQQLPKRALDADLGNAKSMFSSVEGAKLVPKVFSAVR